MRQFGLPAAVLIIGLGATAAMSDQLHRLTNARDAERFDVAADHLQEQIEVRVETYVAMLRAGAGLFSASDVPSASEFREFADKLELDQRYPGIRGIGFSQRLAPADDEIHTIRYLEPLDPHNREAIGYDMFSEPTRRAAMERARDTGEPAASGQVTLVPEIDDDKQAAFLIYVPVYDGADVPATIAERRRRLLGFVFSPFRMGDLFAGILGPNPRARVGFELFDGAMATGEPLYRTAAEGEAGRITGTRTLDVAGRRWAVGVFSTAALDRSSTGALVPFVVWGASS